jgi:formylglycine-generating enzyme required for sulfatase activity
MVTQNSQDPAFAPVETAQGPKPSFVMGAIGLGASLLLSVAIFTAVGGFRHRGAAPPRKPHTRTAEPATRAALETPRPAEAPGPAPEGMVWIPGGEFWMGDDDERDAWPLHRVRVSGFWMDRTEVTNEQFARFVRETGYVTVAERKPDAKDYPGAPPENLVPGSIVFKPPSGPVPLSNHYVWWDYLAGADWRHPEGPASSIADRGQHPVVQVCWDDAVAYCKWAGKRLPTEAEWEFAGRGGLERKRYVWGSELNPGGKWMVNNWQGQFPNANTAEDGFARTAPVGSFPPNGYGLVDMAGNVWEWCADWYQPVYPAHDRTPDPQGPDSSHDPQEPGVAKRVQRGGSFLCSDQYCTAYRPGARGKGAPDSGTPHLGFRCVLSPKPND